MPFKLLNQNHRLLIIVSIVCTSSNVIYCTTCTPAKCFTLVRPEKLGDSLGDVKNINKDALDLSLPNHSLKNILENSPKQIRALIGLKLCFYTLKLIET